jgi:hypothetical protein
MFLYMILSIKNRGLSLKCLIRLKIGERTRKPLKQMDSSRFSVRHTIFVTVTITGVGLFVTCTVVRFND